MIRVTVEFVPFGQEDQKQVIGTLAITNDGTGTLDFGNYDFAIDYGRDGAALNPYDEGRVIAHPRSSNVWRLVQSCLHSVNLDRLGSYAALNQTEESSRE